MHTPPRKVTISKARHLLKRRHFNIVIFQRLFLLRAVASELVRENRSYRGWRLFVRAWRLKAEIIFTRFGSRRATCYTSVALTLQTAKAVMLRPGCKSRGECLKLCSTLKEWEARLSLHGESFGAHWLKKPQKPRGWNWELPQTVGDNEICRQHGKAVKGFLFFFFFNPLMMS